jgi:C4-dicarboxylate-specific signal transduction histidine kinase
MATAVRKSGIGVVGDITWGTHFCHFYETKGDLLDTLVSYFKAGLESDEFCVWVVSEPFTEHEAWSALRQAVSGLDRYLSDRSIEMFLARDWYAQGGGFDLGRVTAARNDKLAAALARGYPGMRVSGSTAWLEKDWRDFCEYEEQLNNSITDQPLAVLCTYPLAACGASELLDVARTHQFAIARRQGSWDVVETPQLKQAKTEIARLNAELEQRVAERTEELQALKDELAADLRDMTRLYELSTRLLGSTDLPSLLDDVLGATIALQHADFGNVQLYNAETSALEILAQRGLSREFLEHFSQVRDTESACGRAMQQGRRVVIEDVQLDPEFGPHRAAAKAAGVRAVQSTPLFSRAGETLGMISTHFRQPHRPSERELRLTDLYALQASELIEHNRAQGALRTAQAELAHVMRVATVGEMAASLAHEINQPLAAVVTNGNACLRWLGRAQPDLAEAASAVQRIIRDANRASEVVTHTRALLRKPAGDKTPLDVTEVVQETLVVAHAEVVRHRIFVRESLALDLPPILGDRIQLQQVVINLVVNAIEAMASVSDDGRMLDVRTARHDSDGRPAVLVAVRDAGVGAPAEQLPQLFDAFYTTKPSGVGMGLTISRSIIAAHGGRLWATRNAGAGLTFQFSLPATPA